MTDLPKPPKERRKHARRATDMPPIGHNWLVALIVRNPVTVGMTLALLVASIALVLVLGAQGGIRGNQSRLTAFERQQAVDRSRTVEQFCGAINGNAATINRQTDYLKLLILGSVKQSRPFEATFKRLGLPPYRVRLAQAKVQAAGLEKRKVPALDCKEFARKALRQAEELPDP